MSPFPTKNMPISVVGSACDPAHALSIRVVRDWRPLMQLVEHGLPLLKSEVVQPLICES